MVHMPHLKAESVCCLRDCRNPKLQQKMQHVYQFGNATDLHCVLPPIPLFHPHDPCSASAAMTAGVPNSAQQLCLVMLMPAL